MDCPNENALAGFVGGDAGPDDTLETHLQECSQCRFICRALSSTTASVLGDESASLLGAMAPRAELDKGTQIGHFEIIGLLATGGMGHVYEARDCNLERRVALKLLALPPSSLIPDLKQRLIEEAKALARLQHSNVVAVYEVAADCDDVHIAMEFVEGETVTDWLAGDDRSVREILSVFAQAARGLSAAHAADLVHRDVKAQNLIVRSDGHAKVIDFGLVRAACEELPRSDKPLDNSNIDPGLTLTGVLVGTPAYASPEQISGSEIGAESDVFSFCVTLYEALTGTRPFRGTSIEELRSALQGAETPGMPVRWPGRLQRLLTQGLSLEPSQRPSMAALATTLEGLLSRRSRNIKAAIAISALAGALVVGQSFAGAKEERCTGSESRVQSVWSAAQQNTLQSAILATGLPFAQDTWDRVESEIGTFTSEWKLAHVEACEAVTIRKEQSPRMLDLRMACLDTRLRDVDAAITALTQVDAGTVRHAIAAVGHLESVDQCGNLSLIEEMEALPNDETARREIIAIQDTLSKARTHLRLGSFEQALKEAQPAAQLAKTLRHRPTEARALSVLGDSYAALGKLKKAAAAYEESILASVAGGDQRWEAEVLASLTQVKGAEMAHFEEARKSAQRALALVERIGDPVIEASVRHAYGSLLETQGQPAQAAEQVTLGLAALGSDNAEFDRALVHSLLLDLSAAVHTDSYEFRRAIELQEESLEITKRLFGGKHPHVAQSLEHLASSHYRLDENDKAKELLKRATEIRDAATGEDNDFARLYFPAATEEEPGPRLEKLTAALEAALRLYGEVHPNVAMVLYGMGETELELHLLDEGLAHLERSVTILRALQAPESQELFAPLWTLSQAYSAVSKSDEALEAALACLVSASGDAGTIALAKHRLAEVHVQADRWAEALPYLDEVYPVFEADRETFGDSWILQIEFWQTTSHLKLGHQPAKNRAKAVEVRRKYSALADADPDFVKDMNRALGDKP